MTKEAYSIYMSIKKLTYYLEDADIVLRSDHLPLKKFLEKNTLNTKVNNWAIEISPYRIKFEYIKGIKNTLADTMSRLITIIPEIQPDPRARRNGMWILSLSSIRTHKDVKQRTLVTKEVLINQLTDEDKNLIQIPNQNLKISLKEKDIINIQKQDPFCKRLISQLLNKKMKSGIPYYMEDSILKRYITDNKQKFETTVVNQSCAPMLLKMAHDQMGHNGSART